MKWRRCRNYNTKKQFETILPTLMKLCGYVEQLTSGPIMPFSIQRKFKHTLNKFMKQVSEEGMADSSPDVSSASTSVKDEDDSSTDIEKTPVKQNSIFSRLSKKRQGSDGSSGSPKKIKVHKSSTSDIFKMSDEHETKFSPENDENLSPTITCSQRFHGNNEIVEIPELNVPIFDLGSLLSSDEPDSETEYYKKKSEKLKQQELELWVQRASIKNRYAIIDAEEAAINDREIVINDEETIINERESVMNERRAAIDERRAAMNERRASMNNERTAIARRRAAIDAEEAEIDRQMAMVQQYSTILHSYHRRVRQKMRALKVKNCDPQK